MDIVWTLHVSEELRKNTDEEIKTEMRNVVEGLTYRGLIYGYDIAVRR